MTVDLGLGLAIALMALLLARLLQAQADLERRVDGLERSHARQERRPVAAPAPPDAGEQLLPGDVAAVGTTAGDGPAISGRSPDGRPAVVSLGALSAPTLLAFLSTSCGICTGIWERLRDGALAAHAAGVDCVVVAKGEAREDLARVRQLSPPSAPMRVVLSDEAWDDYEIPGSPYLLLLSGAPADVVAEGGVTGWDDVVAMLRHVEPTSS